MQVRLADAAAGVTGTATAYVGSGEVTDPNTDAAVTGDTTATRFYTFGGATVAVRADDGALSLILGDEQGSTSVMMPVSLDATGAMQPATLADAEAAIRTSYTPYGELRGADNTQVDRGWLGQVEDAGTGLTYLNARYYDPVLQRFLSPDPLMNPADPRTLDAYRYAENNPVTFTDATGLFAACSRVSGAAESACLAAYYRGMHKPAPTPGKTTNAYRPPSNADPRSRTAFRRATDIAYSKMVDWMRSDQAQQILKDGATNSWTFNEVLVGGIKYSRFSPKHPSSWWDGALGALSLGTFVADPSGAGSRAISAGRTLSNMFPGHGPWDIKPFLRHEFGFDMQYRIMMSDFGVSSEVAISASHTGNAGNPDPQDDLLVTMGYEFRESHPGNFTADDLYDYLMDPESLRTLQSIGRYVPPGAS